MREKSPDDRLYVGEDDFPQFLYTGLVSSGSNVRVTELQSLFFLIVKVLNDNF